MRGYAELRSRSMYVQQSDLVFVNLKALREAVLQKLYIGLIALMALFCSFEFEGRFNYEAAFVNNALRGASIGFVNFG